MGMAAIILGAGRGTRMRSKKAKVLHNLCGRPLISHVIQNVQEAGIERIIVVLGYQGEEVQKVLPPGVEVVWQQQQLGTGHAVSQVEAILEGFDDNVLVLAGDTPLISGQTLANLSQHHKQYAAKATILTTEFTDPTGYGRILRRFDDNFIYRIVEQADATEEERQISEVNTGTYCFDARNLFEALNKINAHNAQGEYYLTDVIHILAKEENLVAGYVCQDSQQAQGINDKLHLAWAEGILRQKIRETHLLQGVTMLDLASTFIDDNVQIGADTIIYPGVILEGNTVIGEECIIGPGVRLINSQVGNGVCITNSTIVDSQLGDHVTVGPYAYIRPGCVVGPGGKVGDFVELKNCTLGEGSKVPHLSYVGDALIGKGVNIGAGVITCNYDGQKKHVTTIEDGAFIGSNSNLIAPVRVGPGAYVAAGSTITEEVPKNSLGIARAKQSNRENWVIEKNRKQQG